ncbi:MAG: hypothetical protein MUE46_20005 [Xanthomonadales bacterium]|nr:hypothetical protein [Xanthomonadales bacterium]
MTSLSTKLAGLATLLLLVTPEAFAQAAGAVAPEFRWLTFLVFGAIIAMTMYVTYLAARRVSNASQFYAAGRSVTGVQNGWAIAGDYLSAATTASCTRWAGWSPTSPCCC